jgi:cytochrome b
LSAPLKSSIAPVPVWDWPVRVLHWAFVVLVAVLITTGLVGDDALVWHMRCGEVLLALVLFRIVWGFVGSRNARFVSFVRGPRAVIAYARSLFVPPHHCHATHNPLGALMVVTLLLVLLFQATTGLFANDDIMVDGPLVKKVTKDFSDFMSSLHRRGWWVIAGLVVVHITAVISYLIFVGDNLIRPMVTGIKQLPLGRANPKNAAMFNVRAIAWLAICGVAVWWLVNWF